MLHFRVEPPNVESPKGRLSLIKQRSSPHHMPVSQDVLKQPPSKFPSVKDIVAFQAPKRSRSPFRHERPRSRRENDLYTNVCSLKVTTTEENVNRPLFGEISHIQEEQRSSITPFPVQLIGDTPRDLLQMMSLATVEFC
jgi:hypothetical protein